MRIGATSAVPRTNAGRKNSFRSPSRSVARPLLRVNAYMFPPEYVGVHDPMRGRWGSRRPFQAARECFNGKIPAIPRGLPMSTHEKLLAPAIAALIALGAAQNAAAEEPKEKCYGIAYAGQNDYDPARLSCPDQAAHEDAPVGLYHPAKRP